jgi:hypothetical protein
MNFLKRLGKGLFLILRIELMMYAVLLALSALVFGLSQLF